jgi:gas vesicle protein
MPEEEKEEKAEARPASVAPARIPSEKPAEKHVPRAAVPVKKMTENTVKGKIAAIKSTADQMQKSVKALQSEFKKQMEENKQAIAEFRSSVKELMNKYQAFAKELQSRVVAMQASIKEQAGENQAYVKDFYG